MSSTLARAIAVALGLTLPAIGAAGPHDVDGLVREHLALHGRADVFVKMKSEADLSAAAQLARKARPQHVHDALVQHADSTQEGIRRMLDARGVRYETHWINNSLFVRDADRALVVALAARADIAYVRGNHRVPLGLTAARRPAAAGTDAIGPNIQRIRAPLVWATGNLGAGVVVANIDTGVRYTHEALVNQYRGNLGNGEFDHHYNWFEPAGLTPAPRDNIYHGTHTMGTLVGGDGPGPFVNDIGVAPGAKWIAVKGCENFFCSDASLIAGAEWIVCPTRTDGTEPDCSRAPDVVSNSWSSGTGTPWYQSYVRAWREAGIIPVFGQGNTGPECGTAESPADYAAVIGVGATTNDDVLTEFSSRGPGTFRPLKPDVVAPGFAIRSAVNNCDTCYASQDGTSMATPHVAGVVALLLAEQPALGYTDVYRALVATAARDMGPPPGPQACGGRSYDVFPNAIYGFGRVDAAAAVGSVR
jgi:subtilisin family serine protease